MAKKKLRRDLITVLDLPSGEFVKLVKRELNLTYLDSDLAAWDFIRDERGKTYEVRVYAPGREVVPAEKVRAYFKKDGFFGNTAAFAAWIAKHDPKGYHTSIPEDDGLFRRDDDLCAPYFVRGVGRREFRLYDDVRFGWGDYWSFVAFREVK